MHKDDLPIPEPCHEDWARMQEAGRRRFCQSCDKHVHDLSAMTEPEVRALLQEQRRGLCVRYTTDRRGQVQLRRPRLSAAAVLAGAALAAPACGTAEASGVAAEPAEPNLIEQAASALHDWIFGEDELCSLSETRSYAAPEVVMGDVMPVIILDEELPEPSPTLDPPVQPALDPEILEQLQTIGYLEMPDEPE